MIVEYTGDIPVLLMTDTGVYKVERNGDRITVDADPVHPQFRVVPDEKVKGKE